MNILFFDTETSGFPSKKLPKNDQKQAWIVQIGIILTVDGYPVGTEGLLIQSDNRKIHPSAQKVHQISTKTTDKYGIPEVVICSLFSHYLNNTDIIVGHNISFDIQMVELLLLRNGMESVNDQMHKLPHYCTMKESTNLCKLPSKYGYKWPKLTELYSFLFNEEFPAHDAIEDIKATMRCFFELQKQGVIMIY